MLLGEESLRKRVSEKPEMREVRGGIRLAVSDSMLVGYSDKTWEALLLIHPSPPPYRMVPPPPTSMSV